jgi:hypothetical protein
MSPKITTAELYSIPRVILTAGRYAAKRTGDPSASISPAWWGRWFAIT